MLNKKHLNNWGPIIDEFRLGTPFHNVIIDDFFDKETAVAIASEFPDYDDPNVWFTYDNNLELKKITNNWNSFGPTMYKAFQYLNTEFVQYIEALVGKKIYPDNGLHGGGMHIHCNGGKLNIHKDYSIHPKLGLQRKINIIMYMTPGWESSWGGGLQLCEDIDNQPGDVIKYIDCVYNRAVIFDTTQNSWHGLPDPIKCPEWTNRRSLAAYYLTDPASNADPREKALYAPHGEQKNDPKILDMIRERADGKTFANAYRKKV